MPLELPSQYNPKDVEEKWFDLWAKPALFHASLKPDKKPFTIVIPPPNVTGILHMGHALNNIIQDILIRTRRMQGFEALWMPGTDHAGIATQNVVERQLAREGKKRQELGREEFLKRVWKWKEEHGSTIIHQLKRMGSTCDWQRERFTMDEGYSAAVVEAFVRFYEKGLIYRGDYIINWCPRCQTALADEEAPHHELDGKLYYIKYPLKKSTVHGPQSTDKKKKTIDHRPLTIDSIIVATTRPETMLGDTAVAVNPTDKRYKHLIGQFLILPLMEREIKIIGDKLVDKKFGTGAVKVTPSHDPNDYVMGKEHNLEFINIMHPDGVLNTNAGEYAGMDRFEAREAILEDLKERKLLLKVDDHKHAVGHCYRCHTIIEPYLSKQWFVKMKPLSKPALEAVKKAKIKFTPKRWTKVYLNWMENIRDWCISRQIWWGHRLPVYYCQNCQKQANESIVDSQQSIEKAKTKKTIDHRPSTIDGIIVSRVKPEKCPTCGSTDLKQDEDVLDTWFSSWLWPFATFGWPFEEKPSTVHSQQSTEKEEIAVVRGLSAVDQMKKELSYFYPTSILVTAPEIIFFWVARMIMAGCEFMGEIPFRDVYIHGTVRDVEGRKMSKSLGNSIDPLEIIDQFGADALRFSLIAIAASGSDIYLSQERFEQGRNFANKIWNASRFILMNLKSDTTGEAINIKNLKIQDYWILTELNQTIKKVTKSIDNLKLNEAINAIYEFFWHKYCDWYVEIAKASIDDKNTQEVLVYVLKKSLLLLNPFMPFITDEVSSKLPGKRNETIAIEAWPKVDRAFENKEAVGIIDVFIKIIFGLRFTRIRLNLSPQQSSKVKISVSDKKKKILEEILPLIKKFGQIEFLDISTDKTRPKDSYRVLIDKDIDIYLLLEGLVDVEQKKIQLEKNIEGYEIPIRQKEALLKNKNFIKKAPKAVIEVEKQKLKQLKEEVCKLKEDVDALK